MKVKMIKVALGFCLLSQILTAQEIFLLPQGKDHPFPDSNLFKYIQTKQICWECDGGYESVATNLMKAVEEGNLDKISKLLQNGADINEANGKGYCPNYTPLYVSVIKGNQSIISYLLKQGANPNDVETWKQIIDNDLNEIASLLLMHKAMPSKDMLRRTIIFNKTDIFKTILEAHKENYEEFKNELLQLARKWDREEIVSLLDLQYKPLQQALQDKNIKRIQDIISSHSIDSAAYILLHASKNGNLAFVKTLFESEIGLQTEYTDYQGNTPLMLAVMNGHLNIVRFLLEQGAQADTTASFVDVTQEIQDSMLCSCYTTAYTALMKASERRDKSMINLLVKYGAKDRLLILLGSDSFNTVSAGVNEKCSHHRHAHYTFYPLYGEPLPVQKQPWEKECDFPTEIEIYNYFSNTYMSN